MKLQDKLNSISHVGELDEMLRDAHVSISWWGERLITIGGYEGSSTIDELARTYIESLSRFFMTMEERVTFCRVWAKLEELYAESQRQVKITQVYRFIIPVIEFRSRYENPMKKLEQWDKEHGKEVVIFQFTSMEYEDYWPQVEKPEKVYNFWFRETWHANKEMVEAARQRNLVFNKERVYLP